jgi:hypothetical protein
MLPRFFPLVDDAELADPEPILMVAHVEGARQIGWWVLWIAVVVLAVNLVIGFYALRYSRRMAKADAMKERILGGKSPFTCTFSLIFLFRSGL